MKKATYKVMRFPKVDNRYVAVAWNYDEAVLIATRDFETYTDARASLDAMCESANVKLAWFDGEYDVIDGLCTPRKEFGR